MEATFPHPTMVQSCVPRLEGMRLDPFTNIQTQTFGRPTLNGFWRVDLRLVALTEHQRLSLSAFHTAMTAGNATCVIPLCVHHRPLDNRGRRMGGRHVAPEWTVGHTGFAAEPFGGFTLRSAASHRDSFIDVNKPALSDIMPGHHITLDDCLYHVVGVVPLDERDDRVRVSVMPNIRGNHAAGKVVVVDQLRLRCMMESGDQVGFGTDAFKVASFSLIEAF